MIEGTQRAAEAPSFAELAVTQKVEPVMEFDDLLGSPSDDDESIEEFSAMLHAWRREGPAAFEQG
jgi:hypothetical protein